MALFRKRETYNEQMLREAGLDRVVFNTPQVAPTPPSFATGEVSLGHGHRNPREGAMAWDATATAIVAGVEGDRVEFTTLPNGDLIVSVETGDGDLAPLADAIEQRLSPPYKAAASRQEGDLWGVGAKRIDVAEFAFPGADALELSHSAGVTELRADGEPSSAAPPPELQRRGEQAGSDFCVEATRIDGDYWEVRVSPL